MNDDDRMLADAVRKARTPASVPPFGRSFAAAERQIRLRRRLRLSAVGLAAMVALVAINLRPVGQDQDFIYVDREELAASTSWSAPSDSLLPTHEFDIYQEIPRLFESTEPDGGALL